MMIYIYLGYAPLPPFFIVLVGFCKKKKNIACNLHSESFVNRSLHARRDCSDASGVQNRQVDMRRNVACTHFQGQGSEVTANQPCATGSAFDVYHWEGGKGLGGGGGLGDRRKGEVRRSGRSRGRGGRERREG